MKPFYIAVSVCLLSAPGGCSETNRPVSPAPDNTGVNVRDRNDAEKTPVSQSQSDADIKLTANIRQKVTDTKLSVNAQNIKIITQNGQVTLRGPVNSVEEKQQLETIANGIAGADNVDSQLEVAARP